jgi:hypothetical protein
MARRATDKRPQEKKKKKPQNETSEVEMYFSTIMGYWLSLAHSRQADRVWDIKQSIGIGMENNWQRRSHIT